MLAAGALAACAALGPAAGPPIDARASLAMLDASDARRARPSDAFAGLDAARLAATLAPDWVAPQRFLDEAKRADLRGPAVLAERRAAHSLEPSSATHGYLLGRLGGPEADALLARSRAADPSLGWAWHGLAWSAHVRGEHARAIRDGRVAVRLARDPLELTQFASALVRYLVAGERLEEAHDLLTALCSEPAPAGDEGRRRLPAHLRLRDTERAQLAVDLAATELASEEEGERRSGALRALALLGSPSLTGEERARLARALAEQPDASRDEMILALTAVDDEHARALRAELMRLGGDSWLAAEIAPEPVEVRPRERLGAAFAAGEPASELDAWLASLPPWTRASDGAPQRAELAALVRAVRAAAPLGESSADSRAELAEALLAAGWFDEAEALALRGVLPLAEAEDVQRRALAARTSFDAIGRLLTRVDRGEPTELATESPSAAPSLARVTGLGQLLDAVRRRLVERRALGGLDADVADLDATSPRIRYGPIATVVHPGPTFSREDERLGRGPAGGEVPGLAREFLRLGRLALFGEAFGQGGPDGAILRLVHVEERSGEHLGRPFRGTVFWCEGADVPARFSRLGASISGAALHEGYWIDLERVWAEQAVWRRLQGRFEGSPERVRAALDVIGPRVPAAERAHFDPALGAAHRMRLAVMAERSADLEVVSVAELARVVAIHEEGHLCDRAAWYPLGDHLGALLSFAFQHRFSGRRIAEVLEERAQLVALAESPDPRLAWVDLLDAAEVTGPSVTPHAGGYRRVLASLLARLSKELDRGEWPELDGERRLVDQLHRLDPERLRGLAVREAAARGLVH